VLDVAWVGALSIEDWQEIWVYELEGRIGEVEESSEVPLSRTRQARPEKRRFSSVLSSTL
jgi:hypothetical protein